MATRICKPCDGKDVEVMKKAWARKPKVATIRAAKREIKVIKFADPLLVE